MPPSTNHHQPRQHNCSTTLNYWEDPGNGLPPTPITIGAGRITNTRPHTSHPFTITDISGHETSYSLDTHGFQYIRHISAETLFTNEHAIVTAYYDECKELLKSVTGANRVHVFNHKVRRGPTHWHHLGFDNLKNRGPVTRTHVDQSYAGAELRLRWEFGDEVEEILQLGKRYQIINVWRPIAPILKDPITVADARTVPDKDLVEADMTEDGFAGKQWVVKYSSKHKWYFKYGMGTGDVLLIKCFDSKKDVARRALHSAFEDGEYAGEEARQSVEVRCVVVYD